MSNKCVKACFISVLLLLWLTGCIPGESESSRSPVSHPFDTDALLAPSEEATTPIQIFIVRHGEKPDSGPDLSPRGVERAKALVGWFPAHQDLQKNGRPVAVYAAGPAHDGSSMRSIETCSPFAEANAISLNRNFTKNETADAAAKILADPVARGKAVLICWEHNMIPVLATALGAHGAPANWPDTVFDRVWVLEYSHGAVVSFKNIPQKLLPGDSED